MNIPGYRSIAAFAKANDFDESSVSRHMRLGYCRYPRKDISGRDADMHPLYSTWLRIRKSCYNFRSSDYSYYGGRGIRMCGRWFTSFWDFVEDMGDRPKGATIERIDNNGPYSPDNCRWASRLEQNFNQRIRSDNSSGYRGVCKVGRKWKAKYRGRVLGYFDTIDAAADEYVRHASSDPENLYNKQFPRRPKEVKGDAS